ncbi:MAG: hypothetical protein IT289_08535, partial [Oligoflexia bacterium]|nr:hypothetical protein [Oligoflexia bacterium]
MSLLKQNMIILVALSCLAIPRVGFAQAQLGPMDCKPLETQTFCFPGTILPPGGNENNPCSDCTFCRGPAKTMINSRIQCVEEECVRY